MKQFTLFLASITLACLVLVTVAGLCWIWFNFPEIMAYGMFLVFVSSAFFVLTDSIYEQLSKKFLKKS